MGLTRVVGAVLEAAHLVLRLAARGQHDDAAARALPAQAGDGFEAGAVRQHHVDHGDIGLFDQGRGLGQAAGLQHRPAPLLQEGGDFLAQFRLVLEQRMLRMSGSRDGVCHIGWQWEPFTDSRSET